MAAGSLISEHASSQVPVVFEILPARQNGDSSDNPL